MPIQNSKNKIEYLKALQKIRLRYVFALLIIIIVFSAYFVAMYLLINEKYTAAIITTLFDSILGSIGYKTVLNKLFDE